MTSREQDRLKRLTKRLHWLEKRYLESDKDLAFDRAEASAIRWAIEYIQQADRQLDGFSIMESENTLGLDPELNKDEFMEALFQRAVELVDGQNEVTVPFLRKQLFIGTEIAEELIAKLKLNNKNY